MLVFDLPQISQHSNFPPWFPRTFFKSAIKILGFNLPLIFQITNSPLWSVFTIPVGSTVRWFSYMLHLNKKKRTYDSTWRWADCLLSASVAFSSSTLLRFFLTQLEKVTRRKKRTPRLPAPRKQIPRMKTLSETVSRTTPMRRKAIPRVTTVRWMPLRKSLWTMGDSVCVSVSEEKVVLHFCFI